MVKRNMRLSPPWEEIHNVLQAFFESDSKIIVDQGISNDYVLEIRCHSKEKFDALNKVLRKRYEFEKVTLKIFVSFVSDNETYDDDDINQPFSSNADMIEVVLRGNKLFSRIVNSYVMFTKMTYCLFKKEVIQFYNDDLTDLNGNSSMLAEDIARIIFDTEDVNFCTELN